MDLLTLSGHIALEGLRMLQVELDDRVDREGIELDLIDCHIRTIPILQSILDEFICDEHTGIQFTESTFVLQCLIMIFQLSCLRDRVIIGYQHLDWDRQIIIQMLYLFLVRSFHTQIRTQFLVYLFIDDLAQIDHPLFQRIVVLTQPATQPLFLQGVTVVCKAYVYPIAILDTTCQLCFDILHEGAIQLLCLWVTIRLI